MCFSKLSRISNTLKICDASVKKVCCTEPNKNHFCWFWFVHLFQNYWSLDMERKNISSQNSCLKEGMKDGFVEKKTNINRCTATIVVRNFTVSNLHSSPGLSEAAQSLGFKCYSIFL